MNPPPKKKKKADTFEEEMEDRGYYASLKRLEVVFFFPIKWRRKDSPLELNDLEMFVCVDVDPE